MVLRRGPMKLVVTGGSGQLGTLLLARLIAHRKVKRIVSLDLLPPLLQSPKLDWKIADVRDPGLDRHFEGADALVHLAFIVARPAPADVMHSVNVSASKRMFSHAASNHLKTIVYASSIAAYGVVPGHPEPIIESTPRRRTPGIAYADNKYEVEEHLDEFERQYPEVRTVRLRPAILVGRRMDHAFGALLRRRLVPRLGNMILPLVWDEDVADAAMLALFGEQRGAFNLVAEPSLSSEELAAAAGMRVVDLGGWPVRGAARVSRLLSRLRGSGGFDRAWLDASEARLLVTAAHARKELGWYPSCPAAQDVIRRFVDEAPRRLDPRVALFMRLVRASSRQRREAMKKRTAGIDLVVHLNLIGPNGGDFTVTIQQGQANVQRGVPRPPSSVVTMHADTLLELLAGSSDLASARFARKIKIQGDPYADFVIGALVAGFRRSVESDGARGALSRRLEGWFKKRELKSASGA
jgi:nucleoside-diphosphate-sugar epimerase